MSELTRTCGNKTVHKLIFVLLIGVLELEPVPFLSYHRRIWYPSLQLFAFTSSLRPCDPVFAANGHTLANADSVRDERAGLDCASPSNCCLVCDDRS